MKPVIQIQTIPIAIEFRTTPAQVERTTTRTEVEIRRDQRGLSINSRPIRLSMDSFEARNTITPTAIRSMEDHGRMGRQAAFEAVATFAREGNMMMDIHLRENVIPQIARNRIAQPMADFNIRFLPEVPVNMDWIPQEIHIDYQMDELNFNWRPPGSDFHFTPARIEFTVLQQPQVIIEFIGEPIYVPASANPNYVPVVNILT